MRKVFVPTLFLCFFNILTAYGCDSWSSLPEPTRKVATYRTSTDAFKGYWCQEESDFSSPQGHDIFYFKYSIELRDKKRWNSCLNREIHDFITPGPDKGVYAIDKYQRTVLHRAAAIGNVDAVRRILEAGGEIDIPDSRGCTPLMYALFYAGADRQAVRLLLERGAQVEPQTQVHFNPLELAIENGLHEFFTDFKERKANIYKAREYIRGKFPDRTLRGDNTLPGMVRGNLDWAENVFGILR